LDIVRGLTAEYPESSHVDANVAFCGSDFDGSLNDSSRDPMETAMANAEELRADGQRTVAAARAMAPQIRAAAAEIEEGRRLPVHIVQAMRRAGIFRMAMPHSWGGPELDPLTQIRVIEALAEADGSVGWCAMINSDSGYFSAFLDQAVAREMYADLDAATCSSLLFAGRAQAVDGGYRVSGRWPFASGCHHSAWFMGSCTVVDGDVPRTRASGTPELRWCLIPTTEGEILDTWYTTGLRGSGSNDFSVTDRFVPAERTCSFPDVPQRRPGALYALPLMFLYNASGVPLGIARGAINAFIELASRKPITIGNLTGHRMLLQDEGFAQSALAHAEALVGSARSFVFETIEELWVTLLNGERPGFRQRSICRLALANAYEACTKAVAMLYKAHGGKSVYTTGPLDRYFRDIHTINQHTIVSLKVYEKAGAALMGLDSRDPTF
jgi:indole-3-acetate monooxygenase